MAEENLATISSTAIVALLLWSAIGTSSYGKTSAKIQMRRARATACGSLIAYLALNEFSRFDLAFVPLAIGIFASITLWVFLRIAREGSAWTHGRLKVFTFLGIGVPTIAGTLSLPASFVCLACSGIVYHLHRHTVDQILRSSLDDLEALKRRLQSIEAQQRMNERTGSNLKIQTLAS